MGHEPHPYCRCLFYSANALARNLTRMAEEAFAPTGLAPSLGFVLMTVNRQPGLAPSAVAQLMMLSPSTVTRLVEKLEGKGLLRREVHGRSTSIRPTQAGKQLQAALQAAWQQVFSAYSSLLGETEGRQLTEQVYAAAIALERTGARHPSQELS